MDENFNPPAPIAYTVCEGDNWAPWHVDMLDAGDVYAIAFDNGWIFDTAKGWRRGKPD